MLNSFLYHILMVVTTTTTLSTVKDCAAGRSVFTLNNANITPANPVPGDKVIMNVDYTVPDPLVITDGASEFQVTYNFIPFAPTIEPLCANVPCPLGPGFYSNATETQWPTSISGTVTSQMKWFDQDRNLLLCVALSIKSWSQSEMVVTKTWPKSEMNLTLART
jgi:hypothetical protein